MVIVGVVMDSVVVVIGDVVMDGVVIVGVVIDSVVVMRVVLMMLEDLASSLYFSISFCRLSS